MEIRRRYGIKRGLALIFVTVITTLVVTSPVASAHRCGCGMSTASYSVNPYNYNSTWQQPMDKAIANWYYTDSPAYITKSEGAYNTVVAARYSATWYGLYQRSWQWLPRMYYFDIKLNARTISRDASNFSNFVTSVNVHEYGHGFDLDDNPPEVSIMRYDRNRNTMTKPSRHDVDDVNAYYVS